MTLKPFKANITTRLTPVDGVLPDLNTQEQRNKITATSIQNQEELMALKAATPARIGIGGPGPRLSTHTYLTLRGDHASARDSVWRDVNDNILDEMGLFSISTKCTSRQEHLTRPDLGRQLTSETKELLLERCTQSPQIQIYVADGLSSQAVDANVKEVLPTLLTELHALGITTGIPFFMRYGRVPAMDVVSELLDAEITCVLLGERPGLVTPNSMSAYIAYRATVGMRESNRTVVSNIHSGGIPPKEAGIHIAKLLHNMLTTKKSGVQVKPTG